MRFQPFFVRNLLRSKQMTLWSTQKDREKEYTALYHQRTDRSRWEKLAVCPDKRFAIPLAVDKQTLIVPVFDGLLKYDKFENKWSEYYKYPIDIDLNRVDYVARFLHFDTKSKVVYAIVRPGNTVLDLVEIDMTHNSCRVLAPLFHRECHNKRQYSTMCPVSVQIEHELHWMMQHGTPGRWKHTVWNKKTNSLSIIKMDDSVACSSSSYAGLVHLKKRKSFLLIDLHVGLSMYSIMKQKWSMLKNVEIVERLQNECALGKIDQFGYVVCKDDRFLVLFTGFIWIIDLWQKMTTRKSKLVCPLLKGCFHAVLVNEEQTDQCLCDGYIRECWNEPEMEQLMCLPVYLIRLIQTFYSEAVVHLFETYHQIGHWKINLSDILSL